MKRTYAIIITLCAFACIVHGARGADYGDAVVLLQGGTNTAAAVTGTVNAVRGPIVQMHVILGTATNVDVDIVIDPAESTEDSFTLYSADDVDADKVLYPVFDRHGSGGAALTSDPPGPYVCMGDPIHCIVSDWAQTGRTVRVRIVWETD